VTGRRGWSGNTGEKQLFFLEVTKIFGGGYRKIDEFTGKEKGWSPKDKRVKVCTSLKEILRGTWKDVSLKSESTRKKKKKWGEGDLRETKKNP